MAKDTLSLSGDFETADEGQWIEAVSKALKGGSPEQLARQTADGLTIKALYREADWPSATDPLGAPGHAPFLRGGHARNNAYLPWDIRQSFAHPDPATTNKEILRDLERGVSSIEVLIDPEGDHGCAICNETDMTTVLEGVDAAIAPVAVAAVGPIGNYGLESAQLLAAWAGKQAQSAELQLAFNLAPLASLATLGTLEESLQSAFARSAILIETLSKHFPKASLIRIDARPVHESGGTDAQELASLIGQGIDTLRRLSATGLEPADIATRMLFTLSTGPNYATEMAKLRAARRLWARCLDALNVPAHPMALQSYSSRRMLTRRDPWVNMLRNTAACFAGGVGGADIVTLRAFTDALGVAEELARRTGRNTQIIAQEESGLGRVADPAGGAWFIESHAEALANAAWAEFQTIENEGGFGESLKSDKLQSRIAQARKALQKMAATRKSAITGVSEYPLLEEIHAPVADVSGLGGKGAFDVDLPGGIPEAEGEDFASPLWAMRLAEGFETLRDHADDRTASKGKRPAIFLATLGPLAEHTARADFARNLFAAGGIEAKAAPVPPKDMPELVAAYKASGAQLAVICGADIRYADETEEAAKALKAAGVQRLYLAGKPGNHKDLWAQAGIDSYIHMGVDAVATLELAHAELGITQ